MDLPTFHHAPLLHEVRILSCGEYPDDRGYVLELFRSDSSPCGRGGHVVAMAYMSETYPGVTRGPHAHLKQADLFVFLGPGPFDLYLWDNRPNSPTYIGKLKVRMYRGWSIRIVPGIVHAYKNVGTQPGLVFNAPDALYAGVDRQGPVDEIRYEDLPDSPFQLWD